MISKIYQSSILSKPKLVLLLLLITAIFFGYKSKDFRLDASSETLLIDGDPDLKYLQEINEKFGAKEFLVLTLTPNEKITSENTINNILSLKYKIQSLNWVHNTITILDIPLLDSSDEPLMDRIKNFRTLKDENIDRDRGFQEILNSPVFKNFVISEDAKTTGIIVNIKEKEKPQFSAFDNKKEIENYKDSLKKERHQNIIEIREIIKSFEDVGKIHLGGIPMIADDMMTFIKNDIIVFGFGVFLFIVFTLWYVFRKLIWIFIPISSCFFSVLIMSGFLGIMNWKVTVISSNFIALMLILTMAMNIHMSTRFLQLKKEFPNLSLFEIITLTLHRLSSHPRRLDPIWHVGCVIVRGETVTRRLHFRDEQPQRVHEHHLIRGGELDLRHKRVGVLGARGVGRAAVGGELEHEPRGEHHDAERERVARGGWFPRGGRGLSMQIRRVARPADVA